ncbi:Hypothetical predicted protein [Mytilus galloprovincialis]|uniref:C2H2-type domain-containing protein n=1 Tax=Mytilus galloprovincialis TaxID=29158 RepID=A0A8B6CP52_MYTGA|nr:Hypothetical predicted protein [Mytilus galloprovincialis]
MDDELDYGPFDGEIPERLEEDARIKGSSRNLSKARLCPVCPGRFTNVRRHVFHQHLPWYTNPLTACWTCHKQFGQNKMLENHCLELHNCNIADNIFKEEYQSVWTELMNGLLLELCQRYDKKTLDHLVEYVRTEAVFKQCQSAVFHWTDIPLLNFYNKKNRFDVEVIHAVFPPSAIYSLVHWKILALLLKGTEDAENLITFEKEISLYQCSIQKAIMVTDSHFHLDKMKQQARFSGLPIYKWKDGESVYQIRHLIANYAFPRRWPTIEEMGEIRRDRRIRSTAEYRQCKAMFPNGKFGISPFLLMDNKYPGYRATVCEMKLEDLVLETDSPYLKPQGHNEASPGLLKEIIWKLASMFDVHSEEIARVTTRNASQLYNIN